MTQPRRDPRVPTDPTEAVNYLAELSRQLQEASDRLDVLDEDAVRKQVAYELVKATAFINAGGPMDLRARIEKVESSAAQLEAELAAKNVRSARRAVQVLMTRIEVGRTYSATMRSEIGVTRSGAYGA